MSFSDDSLPTASLSPDVDAPPEKPDQDRELEQKARRLFEVSIDLLCIAHPSGYFIDVNPAFERVLGYSEETLTSRPIIEFVHPDDRDATREALEQLEENEDVRVFRNRYICEDGSVVWLEWQSRAYRDGERIYASARDVTELRRAEHQREQLELKFREAQKLESVAILAGGIAHDFNNILTTILGNAGLIEMQLADDDPLRGRAEAIRRAASTAADLCEQLLAYAGEGQFDIDLSNLSAIVRETNHLLRAAVDSAADLTVELGADLPPAELDVTQIRQILMNVVNNASEALDGEPGTIRVTTGTRHCDESDFAETYLDDDLEAGEYVTLTVADTGCGMSAEEIERIFDPFYTSKFDGRGLGLAATLGIVRAHEGALRVDSTPGEGTTFEFLFPAVETNQPFTDDDPHDAIPSIEGETILAVDQEAGILSYVRETLESQDLGVLTASSADEAIDIFGDYHDEISAVLLDASLSAAVDPHLVDQLRELTPDLSVVMSRGCQGDLESDGVTDSEDLETLPKPYGPQGLLRSLHRAMG